NTRHALEARDPSAAPAADGEPDLQVATESCGEDRILITVRDRGVGIPPENLPRIWEPYFTTRRGGTGLGLAIVKNVVEALGGTASGREARRLRNERIFDVLVVDNVMPDWTGLDLIRDVTSTVPEGDRPQILMMTAYATVESAIEAMKLGALDYLQKPFEVDELLVVVRRALDHQRLRTEYRYLISERDEQFDHYGIVGRSRAMEEVIRRAELVAETKSTVLILGETGTGKELVARAIHDRSAQRNMPLIKVNCAAIPETLLE